MVNLGRGGTLLVFAKTGGTTGRNPELEVDSTVPICVRFGTAYDLPPVPALVIDANPRWDFSEQPYT